jgi:predicted DNA-binding transcriptional regulator AlpA
MRADANVADGDTPLAALMRETAAATVDTILAELRRRRPIVYPEWLSLQDAAAYTGYSEQQFSDFVKRGVAPKSVLFSRNARCFKRSDVDAWCAARGPSAYSSKGDPGAVRR